MYKFKKEKYEEFVNKFKINGVAEKIGISTNYLSLILNNKKDCKKTVAYCICKAIDSNAEINDYFEIV